MSLRLSFPNERPAFPAGALPSSEMHTINPAATRPVNEIGRFAVKLPDNATFYGDAHYVPIAFEASDAGCESRIVGIPEARLVCLPKYRVIPGADGQRLSRTALAQLGR